MRILSRYVADAALNPRPLKLSAKLRCLTGIGRWTCRRVSEQSRHEYLSKHKGLKSYNVGF